MRGEPPVYSDGNVRFYRIDAEDAAFMTLGGNWYPKDILEHAATRWMSNDATVEVIDSQEEDMILAFETRSFEKNRTLEVFLNNRLVGEYSVGLNYTQINIPNLRFAAGNNTLVFHTQDGCAKQPNRFRAMNLNDELYRCVSFAFQNISIRPAEES